MGVNAALPTKKDRKGQSLANSRESAVKAAAAISAMPTAGKMMREKRLKLNFKSDFAKRDFLKKPRRMICSKIKAGGQHHFIFLARFKS